MAFKDFFDKYKVLIFVLYTLVFCILAIAIPLWWVTLILSLPLIALSVFILIDIFSHIKDGHLTAVCADGLGTVQITSSAIVKAVRDAVGAMDNLKFQKCSVVNEKSGLSILLNVKILHSKVLEISEVARIFVKKLLEKEMNIRVAKINIVVDNVVYNYKVNKIEPAQDAPAEETTPSPKEGSISYMLNYNDEQSTYTVPSDNFLKTTENEPVGGAEVKEVQDVKEAAAPVNTAIKDESKINGPVVVASPRLTPLKNEPAATINDKPQALTPAPQAANPEPASAAAEKTREEKLKEQRELTAKRLEELRQKRVNP